MAVETTFRIENPEETRASMTITMTIGEWKQVASALKGRDYPLSPLAHDIKKMVDRVTDMVARESMEFHQNEARTEAQIIPVVESPGEGAGGPVRGKEGANNPIDEEGLKPGDRVAPTYSDPNWSHGTFRYWDKGRAVVDTIWGEQRFTAGAIKKAE